MGQPKHRSVNSSKMNLGSKALFPSFDDNLDPLIPPNNHVFLRESQNKGRSLKAPPTMTTFGRPISGTGRPLSIEDSVKMYLGDQVDSPGEVVTITPKKKEVNYQEVHARAKPDISLHSTSSANTSWDTDDLSSMGVPVSRPKSCYAALCVHKSPYAFMSKSTQFPDPLGSWEDLEPGLKKIRSLNLEIDLNRTDVTLTGPTGYPVFLSSPTHPPMGSSTSSQRIHYHYPEGRGRSTERGRSLDRTSSGRTRTPTRM